MKGQDEIYNTQDIIDSRDIIDRIEYLESDDDLDDNEKLELKALKDLESQCNYGDWSHGEALISEDYFETYAKDLAEDIGAIGRDLDWPACHIDWPAAADSLKMDYACVDFDGGEYWIRA